MPIGLITNVDMAGGELSKEEKKAQKERLVRLVGRIKSGLGQKQDIGTVLNSLTDDLLGVSKCKDLVVNKGHYFGTRLFPEEPELTTEDRRALIAYLKTF